MPIPPSNTPITPTITASTPIPDMDERLARYRARLNNPQVRVARSTIPPPTDAERMAGLLCSDRTNPRWLTAGIRAALEDPAAVIEQTSVLLDFAQFAASPEGKAYSTLRQRSNEQY